MHALDHVLEPDETILCRTRCHWWFNLRSGCLDNLFNHFVVTDRRVIEKTGILSARTRSMALAQIESKDVEQSAWGRLFGFGDLLLHGSGGQEVRIRNLADPNRVARAIGRAAAALRAEGGVGGGLAPTKHMRSGGMSEHPGAGALVVAKHEGRA
jgi:hypothetical protein